MQGDVRQCKSDFALAWTNITSAYSKLHGGTIGGGDFHFNTDTTQLREGVRGIGYALQDIAKGVKDCHLEELAELLTKIGVKLGLMPEIGWIEEVLHILVEGVHIETEIGNACLD